MIEDKVHSREHLAQFTYSEAISKRFPKHKILPVYFKTGDQCDYSSVMSAGYKCFLRAEFLGLLRAGIAAGVTNPIYADFTGWLTEIELEVEAFRWKKTEEWARLDKCWIGFFKELSHPMKTLHWAYVPNKSGGFWSADWGRLKWNGHGVYLQMEEDKLCFKIDATKAASGQNQIRDKWMKRVLGSGERQGFKDLKRPKRLGVGNWMTVAYISKEDWLMTDSSGILDLKRTLARLKKAQSLLGRAASS